MVRELLKVTRPGRNTACHVSQVPAMLVRDGYIGMKDFRGMAVKCYQDAGWIYHGEIVIQKNPQSQAVRTKSKSLMFVQLRRDSSWLRPGLADYILLFRKPGENAVPIRPDDISNDDWIIWAHPVWYDIRENNTLNKCEARTENDERHICPLQLDAIDRCIRLWSNRGETVLSPFAGIGSEGYQAIKTGRRFVGIELKPEYAEVAMKNLRRAENESGEYELIAGAN
jgi:DNA modification methylase